MSDNTTFTKESATQFDTVSMASMAAVIMSLKCECQPYIDVFTYNRWKAQGFQVKRGQHGIHLTTFKTVKYNDDSGKERVKKFPKSTVVFCRCQVEPIEKEG